MKRIDDFLLITGLFLLLLSAAWFHNSFIVVPMGKLFDITLTSLIGIDLILIARQIVLLFNEEYETR
jgi:hypothetical protein